jgi:hypothetical protein
MGQSWNVFSGGCRMKNTTSGTTYTVLKPDKKIPPTISFTNKALKWIEALIDEHDTEIGFYGIVEEDEKNYAFLVTDIFYPKHQLVNHATCEISCDGETGVMNWLVDHGRSQDCGKMMLWGHSHHTMGISPSGQDDKQATERMNDTKYHIIRVIVNKEKLMSVSFFDYKQQLKFDNIQWTECPQDNERIQREVLAEIKKVIETPETEMPITKKIIDIDRIMYSDSEMEEIVKKVKELKEINVPKNDNNYTGFKYGGAEQYVPYGSYDKSKEDRFPRLTKIGEDLSKASQVNMFSNRDLDMDADDSMYPHGPESTFPYTGLGCSTDEAEELMKHFEAIQ